MTPPVIIGCSQSVMETVSLDSSSGIVTWTEPTAFDNSGGETTVLRSHEPGTNFPVGTTQVSYLFRDQNGNEATCSFAVIGNGILCLFKSCFSASFNKKLIFFLDLRLHPFFKYYRAHSKL